MSNVRRPHYYVFPLEELKVKIQSDLEELNKIAELHEPIFKKATELSESVTKLQAEVSKSIVKADKLITSLKSLNKD